MSTKVSLSCIRGRPDADLLRIRNPHANEAEWKGPWSDRYDDTHVNTGWIAVINGKGLIDLNRYF